jgi:hypothetical protein
MIIDLKGTAIRMRLRGLVMVLIFSALIITLLFINYFNIPRFGISRAHVIIFTAGVYILIVIYNYFRDYHYIYYNDEGNKIIFRYYSMRPLSQTKKSIEIQRGNLSRFEIRQSFFGIKQRIILYQKVKGGVYKYPPVSISALTKAEKARLKQALNQQLA